MKCIINLIAIFFLTSPLYSQTLLDYQQIKSIGHPDPVTEQTENTFEITISPFSETIKSVVLSKDENLLAVQYGDNGLVI